MRVTVVKSLKRAGYDWPTIQKITGHKSVKSLVENYDPSLDTPERANIGVAIGTAPNLKRGIQFQGVSSSLARHKIEGSVVYNEPEQMVSAETQIEDESLSKKTQIEDESSSKKTQIEDESSCKKTQIEDKSSSKKTQIEENSSTKKPRLADSHPDNSSLENECGLFKFPNNLTVDIKVPRKEIVTKKQESLQVEIPEVSIAEVGDGSLGYNLKGRLNQFEKHYVNRRCQLRELGQKMSQVEEKNWKTCQLDYVNKAIHAPNASSLDIEIANSILRQKEVEDVMSQQRQKERRDIHVESSAIPPETRKIKQEYDKTPSNLMVANKNSTSPTSLKMSEQNNEQISHTVGGLNTEGSGFSQENNFSRQCLQPMHSAMGPRMISRPEYGMFGMSGQPSVPIGPSMIHHPAAMTQSVPMAPTMVHPSGALLMGPSVIHPSAMMPSIPIQNFGQQYTYPQMQVGSY